MKSYVTAEFWRLLQRLPDEVRRTAEAKFVLWKSNPSHPSLRFKKLRNLDVWSIRVTGGYRALANPVDDGVEWFWIGTHAEYDTWIERR